MWDLLVVGGGPAGASAALAAVQARPDARVLLLDRSDFPRDKACGDGIAPHALDVLARLGVDAAPDDPPVSRLARLRGRDTGRGTDEPPGVRRAAGHFDARSVAAARERGVTVRRHQVRSLQAERGHVLVDGEPAQVVIGADGANGVVRRLTGVPAPRGGTVAVAIRGYAPVDPERAGSRSSPSPNTAGRPTRGRSRSATAGPTWGSARCSPPVGPCAGQT